MKQTYEILNVKCGGCANTLKKALENDFKDVEVDLQSNPRKITLDIEPNDEEKLKLKLRSIGYPLVNDELSALETVSTKAKSFVSCAIGKINS